MDDAFHASERTWISKSYFVGKEEVEFLRKWGRIVTKENAEENVLSPGHEDKKNSSDTTNTGSSQKTGNRASTSKIWTAPVLNRKSGLFETESTTVDVLDEENGEGETGDLETSKRLAVLKEIEAMGDEMFGVKSKKKKRAASPVRRSVSPVNPSGSPEFDENDSPSDTDTDEERYRRMLSDSDEDDRSETTSEEVYESDCELFDLDTQEFPPEMKFFGMLKNSLDTFDNKSMLAIEYTENNSSQPSSSTGISPRTSTTCKGNSGNSENTHCVTQDALPGHSRSGDLGQCSQQPSSLASGLPLCSRSSEPKLQEQVTGDEEKEVQAQIIETSNFFERYQRRNVQQKMFALKRDPSSIRWHQGMQRLLEMDDKQYQTMVAHSTLGNLNLRGHPTLDNNITIGGVMPLLAPPIPTFALKANTSLAIYSNFSNPPGTFQWKCKSANEQTSEDIEAAVQMKKRKEIAERLKTCSEEEKVQRSQEIIITVVLYHPSKRDAEPTRPVDPESAVTIQILGSQTLKELRSYFYCRNDLICPEIQGNDLPPLEINVDALHAIHEASLDKPCAIFAGNTIYRNSSSCQSEKTEYGRALMTWASRKRPKPVGPFEMSEMENTRMIDLVFKHGFPYLFIHQGNCEHLFVFEHVRLLNSEDSVLKASYPVCSNPNFKPVYCAVDNKRLASFAVRKMDMFPHDPMIICSECLEQYCYLHNKKVSDFQVYEYHQFSSIF